MNYFDNVKCIFIDIDNTLTNNNKEVTNYTKEVLSKLNKYKIICTGRDNLYAIQKSKDASCSNIVIADNGALIYDYDKNITIYEKPITNNILNKIWNYSFDNNIDCVYNTKKGKHRSQIFQNNDYIKHDIIINDLKDIEEPITQIIASNKEYNKMIDFINYISNIKELKINNTNINKKIDPNKSYYCDINISEVSKGIAAKKLIKYLNINFDDTMAIGDSENDISLFENINFGVAMKNAVDSIKNRAKVITEFTNDEDGLAKFIEKYIIGEEVK